MLKKIRFIALGSAIAAMLALVSCGGQQTTKDSATEDATEETAATETTEEATEDPMSSRASRHDTLEGTIGSTAVSITYGRPKVKGRTVWGELVPYDEVWRTGADEATVFEVSTDVSIEGEMLPAGKYSMFTIPSENGPWAIIFNKTFEQWGAYDYNADEDVLRIEASPEMVEDNMEEMTFMIEEGNVVLRWEKLKLSFPVEEAAGETAADTQG